MAPKGVFPLATQAHLAALFAPTTLANAVPFTSNADASAACNDPRGWSPGFHLAFRSSRPLASGMFSVDEATVEAIRRASEQGELSGVVEFRRHFPLITDNARAKLCVEMILGWTRRPPLEPKGRRGRPQAATK